MHTHTVSAAPLHPDLDEHIYEVDDIHVFRGSHPSLRPPPLPSVRRARARLAVAALVGLLMGVALFLALARAYMPEDVEPESAVTQPTGTLSLDVSEGH